ncbi:hypothetical protein N9N67_09515, partial [Bacteriovoracaceae bacterium]|nr:hypothetical protein [Bacteriovoracaceae bacterium]
DDNRFPISRANKIEAKLKEYLENQDCKFNFIRNNKTHDYLIRKYFTLTGYTYCPLNIGTLVINEVRLHKTSLEDDFLRITRITPSLVRKTTKVFLNK